MDISSGANNVFIDKILEVDGTSDIFDTNFPSFIGESNSSDVVVYASGTEVADGNATTYNIAHGLVSTPAEYHLYAASADAANLFYINANATNLQAIYAAATPAGTGNISIKWYAYLLGHR